jgi:hypothetical protein
LDIWSFAEHTNVQFDEGVTAIVGPNGSGKSNITDAIKSHFIASVILLLPLPLGPTIAVTPSSNWTFVCSAMMKV